jgi:zinc transport system permease protein
MHNIIQQLSEALQFSFMQRALLAGSFIALCCSFLGIFLVLRRFSMIGDGLAHVSFAAIALGLLLKTSPLYVCVPVVVLASLWILKLSERTVGYGDAAIGLLSALGIAVGVIIASSAGGFNVDLFSYLFGNILAISRQEVYLAVALSAAVILTVALFYHDLFAVSFDEDHAKASGIQTGRVNKLLLVLTALTVSLGIKVVGTMLVSSLIIFPAVSSLLIARSFRGCIIWSSIFAVSSVLLGTLVSYLLNLPTGAAIVLVNFACFIGIFFVKRTLRR